jgi:nucleotide-binding universal stress UspA family protein
MAAVTHTVKPIVVGLDGSRQSSEALRLAVNLALPRGSEVVAVHVFPVAGHLDYEIDPDPSQADADQRSRMETRCDFEEEWCLPLRLSGLPYRALMEDGRPATVIADIADRVDAELIVVGRRGRGELAELLLGSVSHELTHHCTRPLVVVSRSDSTAA